MLTSMARVQQDLQEAVLKQRKQSLKVCLEQSLKVKGKKRKQ